MMKTFWRPFLALGPDHWPSNSMTIDRQFTYKRIILSALLNGNLFAPHPANIEQYSTTHYSMKKWVKGTTHLATVLEIFCINKCLQSPAINFVTATPFPKGRLFTVFSNPFNKECNEISPCLPTGGIVVATTTTRPEWIFYCFLFMKTRLLVNKRRYGKEAQFWSRMYVVVL